MELNSNKQNSLGWIAEIKIKRIRLIMIIIKRYVYRSLRIIKLEVKCQGLLLLWKKEIFVSLINELLLMIDIIFYYKDI